MISKKEIDESQYNLLMEIYESYLNGQLHQMVEKIDESFIQYDFWELYYHFIIKIHIKERSLETYAETVIIYNRIKGK